MIIDEESTTPCMISLATALASADPDTDPAADSAAYGVACGASGDEGGGDARDGADSRMTLARGATPVAALWWFTQSRPRCRLSTCHCVARRRTQQGRTMCTNVAIGASGASGVGGTSDLVTCCNA